MIELRERNLTHERFGVNVPRIAIETGDSHMSYILTFLAGAGVGIGVYANWAKIAPALVALKDKLTKPKA